MKLGGNKYIDVAANAISSRLQHQQLRGIVKVRLKWVKNKSLDHTIDIHTDIKAASLLKDAIARSSVGFVTSKSVADWQKILGLTVPTVRFMRRYPTLFHEFPHPRHPFRFIRTDYGRGRSVILSYNVFSHHPIIVRYPSLPCFRLTDIATTLHNQEKSIHETYESDTVQRLSRVLMMTKSRVLPLQSLYPLKWDLGLPDHFDRNLVEKYPDCFRIVKGVNGGLCMKLEKWQDEFAVSELEKRNESKISGGDYRQFKRGQSALSFPMSFPRGYGAQKKVKTWMDEFQKLPYISPYQDSSSIEPSSELMEKRVVGVLHEFLSLTMYMKTKRNYLRSLREEFNLPHKFTRIFTRYPGIFYLSLKCKTTTVTLKEGYQRGKLIDPHPLVRLRDKFYYVMRTGLIYRNKGLDMIPQLDNLDNKSVDGIEEERGEEEEESEVEEIETDDEHSEETGFGEEWESDEGV